MTIEARARHPLVKCGQPDGRARARRPKGARRHLLAGLLASSSFGSVLGLTSTIGLLAMPGMAMAQSGGAGGIAQASTGGHGGDPGQSGGSSVCNLLPVASSCQAAGGVVGTSGVSDANGAGGGGGGSNGNSLTPRGSNGGNGATALSAIEDAGGGGGGAGGNGLIVTQSSILSGLITGGQGGAGGTGRGISANGGDGGDGGNAILVESRGSTITLTAGSIVIGGNGGIGGFGSGSGNAGVGGKGGAAIIGADLTIINEGALIVSGFGDNGFVRADAITFTGGTNRISFTGAGHIIQGDIDVTGTLEFAQPGNFTLSTPITGSGAISKTGAGTLRLTGINSHLGGTTLNEGALQVDNAGALSSGDVTLRGGALQLDYSGSLSNRIVLENVGQSRISASSGRTVTLNGLVALRGKLHFGSPTDTGTIIFSNSLEVYSMLNEYYIDGGTLRTGGSLLPSMLSRSARTEIAAGATLDLNGFQTSIRNLQGNGTILNAGGLTQVQDGTFGGQFAGTQSLEKVGAGTLTLTGSSSYDGTTTLSAGILNIRNSGALGSLASGTVVQAGATLELQGGLTLIEALALNGTGVANGGALHSLSGYNLVNSTITLGSDARIVTDSSELVLRDIAGNGHVLTVGGTGRNSLIGTISNLSGLVVDGPFVVALAGANSYTGPTLVNSGILQLIGGNAIADTGAVTLAPASLMQLANSETIGSLAGSGSVVLQAPMLTTGGNGLSTVFSGMISEFGGISSLTKIGAGTFTLSGTNSYSGLTIINGGTLEIGDGGTSGSLGPGDVVNNATLRFNRSDMFTVGNMISGNGQLIKAGSGTLILTGANSYMGNTIVESGALRIGNGSALGSVAGWTTVNNGATLELQGGTSIGDTLFLSGFGTFSASTGVRDGAVRNLSGDNTLASPVLLQSDSRINSDAGTLYIKGLSGNGYGLRLGGEGAIVFSGPLDNVSSLLKMGTGLLSFTDTNSFSGATSIFAGTLRISGGAAIGDVSSVSLATGATFEILQSETIGSLSGDGTVSLMGTGVTLTVGGDNLSTLFSGTIGGTGGLTKTGSGTFTLTGTNSYSGVTTINAGTLQIGDGGTSGMLGTGQIVNNGTLRIDRSDSITITNNILGGGSLVKSGTGTLLLAGGSSYSGGTIIEGGAVRINNSFGIGFNGATVSAGAAFELEGDVTLLAMHWINGTGIASGGAIRNVSGANRLAGPTFLQSDSRINADAGTLVIQGILGGGFGLVVGGAGTTAFTGVINDLSGLVVDGGMVSITGTGNYTGPTTIAGGTLRLASGNAIADGGQIALLAPGTLEIAQSETIGSLNGDGTLRFTADATLTLGGNNLSGTIGTAIQENGGIGSLTKLGTGTLTLLGANGYSGLTTITAGTIELGNGGISGTLGTGGVVVDGTLRFNRSDDVQLSNAITGSGNLVQAGTGTTTLVGQNGPGADFTGRVDVNAGTLKIMGSFGDTTGHLTQFFVDSGAGLGGMGTVYGNVTIADGGQLSPGNSPGTLLIAGDLTLNAGTILNFELAQAGVVGAGVNDLVSVGGNLTLDGTLNVTALAGFGTGYYRLFDYAGSLIDNGLTLGTTPGGYTAALQTGLAQQVNVLFSDGAQLVQYWDGADTAGDMKLVDGTSLANGGSGIWAAPNTNWTMPTGYQVNGPWASQVGVFGTTGGTVEIEGEMAFQLLRFRADGYVLEAPAGNSGLVTTGGFSMIDVEAGLTTTISAPISGSAGLTKIGGGVLTLSGANSYDGITTVAEGALEIWSDQALGSAIAGTVVEAGAALWTRNYISIDDAVTLNGMGIGGTGSLRSLSEAARFNEIDLGSDARIVADGGGLTIRAVNGNGHALFIGGPQSTAVTGTISDLSALTIDRGAYVSFSGANSFTGPLTIDSGLLQLLNGAAIADEVAVTVNAPGTMQLYTSETIGSLSGAGNVALYGGLLQPGIVTLTVGGNNLSSSFSGSISGPQGQSALTKIGTGTLTLSGANSYSGLTTIEGGVLNLRNGAALGTGAGGTLVQSGAALELQGGFTLAEALTLNGSGIANGGALRNIAGINRITGDILLGSDARIATDADELILTGLAGNGHVLTLGGAGRTSIIGSLSGLSGLIVDSTGVAALSGANDYAGPTTVASGVLELSGGAAIGDLGAVTVNAAGTMRLLASETIGSLAGNGAVSLADGTRLTVGGNDASTTFAGAILGGNGGLTKIGTGTLTLGGTSTYAGLTDIRAGTLQIGSSQALADGAAVSIASGATLDLLVSKTIGALDGVAGSRVTLGASTLTIGANNEDAAFAGVISGTGGLTKIGNGSLTLSGTNSFSGTTTINGGMLLIEGRLAGAVVNNALLDNSGTIEGLVSNGGTFISTGILDNGLSNNGVSRLQGHVNGAVTNNGMIELAGTVTGITALSQGASGSFDLKGFDLKGFDLSVGRLSGAGQILLGAARLTIGSDNGDATFAGAIGGSGTLIKTGTGTQTLAGSNAGLNASVTGGRLVAASQQAIGTSGGTLTLVNGTTFAAGADLAISQSLTITGGSATIDTGAYAVTLTGGGTSNGCLTKTGTGQLNLLSRVTGGGGACVNEGTMRFNSIFDGNVTVTANSRIGGAGTINGNVLVNGILAPGNSPGVLVVNGSVTHQPGSTLALDIDGATAGNGAGHHDALVLSGTGSVYTADGLIAPTLRGITGDASNSFSPVLGQSFTIVTAQGGISGSFDGLTQPTAGLPSNTRFDLIYQSNALVLIVTPDRYALMGNGSNAMSAGGALDAIRPAAGIRVTNPNPIFERLNGLGTAQIGQTLEQLSGSIHASTLDATLQGNRAARSAILQHLKVQRTAGEQSQPQRALWGWASNLEGRVDADRTGQGYRHDSQSYAIGFDLMPGTDWTVGIAGSYGESKAEAGSLGHGRSESYRGSLYAIWARGGSYATAQLGFSKDSYAIRRAAVLTGTASSLMADADGSSFGFEAEAGHRFAFDGIGITPLLGLSYDRVSRDTVRESGDALVALNFAKGHRSAWMGRAGARLDSGSSIAKGRLRGYASGALLAELGERSAALSPSLQSISFRLDGADAGKTGFQGEAGLIGTLSSRIEINAAYRHLAASNASADSISGTVRFRW